MCKLFVGADPLLWKSSRRSVRIDGMVSSLSLENLFWATLEEIAARDSMSVSQLINTLQRELNEAAMDLRNFASFLRVCCLRYLSLQSQGLIPAGATPISMLAADRILAAESERRALPPSEPLLADLGAQPGRTGVSA